MHETTFPFSTQKRFLAIPSCWVSHKEPSTIFSVNYSYYTNVSFPNKQVGGVESDSLHPFHQFICIKLFGTFSLPKYFSGDKYVSIHDIYFK